jgi:DNA-binding transcriptional ArsR family regulator
MPRRLNVNIDGVSRALNNPTRRAIMDTLSEGAMPATRLAMPLNISVAAVLQHLQILEQIGLVRSTQVGRVRMCRVGPAGLSVAEQWFGERRSTWERRFDRLSDLLAETEKE